MKKVTCQQVPSLLESMLDKVVGGRKGYDGCTSNPNKLHKTATGDEKR